MTVRETPFDIYYSTSFTKTSEEEPDFSLAFLAEYANDDFLFRLSLDPFHMVTWSERETFRDWFSYFASFVSALSYTTPDERFSIKLGADLILPPDPFGVTSALTNSFSPTSTMLHALTTYDGDFYSHTISYSDLTFEEEEGYLSYNANITLPGYPVRFGFSLLSAMNHSDISQTRLIPEIYVASPLAFTDSFSLSMQLTVALSTSFVGQWFDGWGISLSLPFVFDSFSFDTGIAYTQGGLQFGEYLNGYATERKGDNTLTLYGRSLFESNPFALIMDLQLPLALETFTLVEGEDYFSVEVSGELFSISLSFGLRLTGLLTDFDKGFEESGEAFIALGYSNEALETKMAIYLDKNLEPEVALTATLSGYRALFARNRNLATSPSWLDIELYTGYNNDSTASLFFRPTVRFNFSNNIAIGLRLPLSISTRDGSFVFSRYGVDPDFNFGMGAESTEERLYDMFTDLFSLFEFIRMGKRNDNFWLLAQRNHSFDNPLFDHYQAYGREGSLGLDVGFVLPGRASAVFQIEDMERPDLFSLTMSMKPMGENGPELILDNVVDLFIESGEIETTIISQFAISQSLLNDSLILSLYFNTHFEITDEDLDLHFTSLNDLSISFGLSLDATISGGWVVPFSFGFNSGWAQEHYYDEFVYLYRERLNKDEENAIFYDPMQLFVDLGFYYEGEHLSFGASYYVPSIQNYLNENSKDRIRLSFSYTINDFTFEANLSRRNFRNSLASGKGLKDYIEDENTVFSLSMEKIFSHLSFYTSIFLTPSYETIKAYNDSIVAVSGSTSLAFSLITSLRF